MCRLRSIVSSLVILLLIAGTTAMASTQGVMRDAVGTMVLCTGTQTVVVHIGADGAPIEATHHCPDCAAHAAVDLRAPFEFEAPVPRSQPAAHFSAPERSAAQLHLFAAARSPPRV